MHSGTTAAYAAWDEATQVEALRRLAHEVATDEYGLEVAGLELLLHGFNTTFRLTTAPSRYAVRVHTNSVSTPTQVHAQQAWLRALGVAGSVHVPVPVPTPDGRLLVERQAPALGRVFVVTVATWLDGDDVGRCDEVTGAALGRAMARLHAHGRRWHPPPGAELPVFDHPLCGDPDLLSAAAQARGHGPVVAEAMRRSAAAYDVALASDAMLPIHGDLHGGNLKWDGSRLAVFDFDDCGMSVPAVDLATAVFYLRDVEPARVPSPEERAVLSGYAEVAPLPALAADVFEGLVAGRQLLLANSLLASVTPAFRGDADAYLEVAIERLTRWLETGVMTLGAPWG